MAVDKNGKKDRSKSNWEIENNKNTFKHKFGEEPYITIYDGGDMGEFYRTIKNKVIKT